MPRRRATVKKMPPLGARRSVVFGQVRQVILDAVRDGNTRNDAARYAGIKPDLLHQWATRGRAGMEPYVSFVSDLKAAESEAVLRMVTTIFKAAEKDWRAALAWLKANRPEVWGDKVTINDAREWVVKMADQMGLQEDDKRAAVEAVEQMVAAGE